METYKPYKDRYDGRMSRNFFLKKEVLTGNMLSALKQLNAMAQDRGQTLSQMSVAWLLRDGMVTSVLAGASSPEQLKTNVGALENLAFSTQEITKIDEILTNLIAK